MLEYATAISLAGTGAPRLPGVARFTTYDCTGLEGPWFARRYRPWYPKAVDVLEDDWERMVAFYDFPEDHWKHLRTTNVVESPFAAVRLRTTTVKRFKGVESARR